MRIAICEKYDIVFLDIEMPALDGISLVRKLRTLNEKVYFATFMKEKGIKYAKFVIEFCIIGVIFFVVHNYIK